MSLSVRRAWIEIIQNLVLRYIDWVALRKESVDRNQGVHYDNYNLHWSLSVRRAWIEIIMFVNLRVVDGSLSVRRAWIEIINYAARNAKFYCRSP